MTGPQPAKQILEFLNLVKTYSKSGREARALDGVSFRVTAGEIVGLVGPNGAGKTTLVKILSRLVSPDEGLVALDGKDMSAHPRLLRQVGVVLEGGRDLYDEMTAHENITYIAGLYGAVQRDAILRSLACFGLVGEARTQVRKLSRGMRQRVSLAACMVHEPRFLVLDEPTNGLDPRAVEDLNALLRALAATGVGIVLATHQLDFAQSVCARALVLDAGRLTYDGPIARDVTMPAPAESALRALYFTHTLGGAP